MTESEARIIDHIKEALKIINDHSKELKAISPEPEARQAIKRC